MNISASDLDSQFCHILTTKEKEKQRTYNTARLVPPAYTSLSLHRCSVASHTHIIVSMDFRRTKAEVSKGVTSLSPLPSGSYTTNTLHVHFLCPLMWIFFIKTEMYVCVKQNISLYVFPHDFKYCITPLGTQCFKKS